MSSKTRNRTARCDNPQPITDQTTVAPVRTDAEDKLWAALHANPNSSAADLSATAKIGKSTAQKILAKWATEGTVSRTPGTADGARRTADRWTIAAIATDEPTTPSVDHNDAQEDNADGDGRVDASTQAAAPAEQDVATATDDATEGGDHPMVTAADDEPTDGADEPHEDQGSAITETTPETAAAEATESTDSPSAIIEVTASADDATADHLDRTATQNDDADEKPERLFPGALTGMVEDHLRDHPGTDFGPVAIAKELGGRSSGAVSNALDKLVARGIAVKTNDKPKRFALAPADSLASAAPSK